jgi:hypothetical protein
LNYKKTDIKENTIYEGQFVRNKFFHKKYPAINEWGETFWVDKKVIYPLKDGKWINYQNDTIYFIEYWKDGKLASE